MRSIMAIVLLLGPAALFAQSGRGDLSGFVMLSGPDNNHTLVTVELTRLGDQPERHRMVSDSGDMYHRYHFKSVRMGEYDVVISAPGYVPYRTTLLIGSDMRAALAVCLRHPDEVPDRSRPLQCG